MQKCTEKANKEARERQQLEQEVLYQTVSELDEAIDDIHAMPVSQATKRRKMLELIKTQIKIRSKFLQQKDAASIKFTVNRKQRPIGELVRELKSIIVQQVQTDESQDSTHCLRENPSQLVKKRIKHKFFDEDTGSEQWYEGYVLRFSKSTQVYTVKYDGEDSTCSFQLDEFLEDISAKDLFVL